MLGVDGLIVVWNVHSGRKKRRGGGGGGAVSGIRVIPIGGVIPLGLPEFVSFLRFCPPPLHF